MKQSLVLALGLVIDYCSQVATPAACRARNCTCLESLLFKACRHSEKLYVAGAHEV